jgi:hypothetical protein
VIVLVYRSSLYCMLHSLCIHFPLAIIHSLCHILFTFLILRSFSLISFHCSPRPLSLPFFTFLILRLLRPLFVPLLTRSHPNVSFVLFTFLLYPASQEAFSFCEIVLLMLTFSHPPSPSFPFFFISTARELRDRTYAKPFPRQSARSTSAIWWG